MVRPIEPAWMSNRDRGKKKKDRKFKSESSESEGSSKKAGRPGYWRSNPVNRNWLKVLNHWLGEVGSRMGFTGEVVVENGVMRVMIDGIAPIPGGLFQHRVKLSERVVEPEMIAGNTDQVLVIILMNYFMALGFRIRKDGLDVTFGEGLDSIEPENSSESGDRGSHIKKLSKRERIALELEKLQKDW